MRAFYWAAFYGLKKYVLQMIVDFKWSPFIKSFKKRSVLSAAIFGQRKTICKIIINDYEYRPNEKSLETVDGKLEKWRKSKDIFKIFGKDEDDNNILHHTYINEMPSVRSLLLKHEYISTEQI